MTKKEQAIQELEQWLDWETATQGQLDDHVKQVIALVHAIDDADREERGVVDVQEIKEHCAQCEFCRFYPYSHEFQCAKETPRRKSWCPRRNENRK